MLLMKKIFKGIAIIVLPIVVMLGCSEQDACPAGHIVTDDAFIEGRNCAKQFISGELQDSVELQNKLFEAKAELSKYIVEGDTMGAKAFDEAFRSTIKTIRPELSNRIFLSSESK